MAKAQLTVEIDEDLLERARKAGVEPAMATTAGFTLRSRERPPESP